MDRLYRHTSFKDILQELVSFQKKKDPEFNFSVLAKILGVQKTYLSKVMNSGGLLSSDHLFLLAEFYSLSRNEQEYLALIAEYERTGLARRKNILRDRIASIQLEQRKTKNSLKAEQIEDSGDNARTSYYLDPFAAVVHICLGMPSLVGDPKKVARYLGLTDDRVLDLTQTLEKNGFVEPIKDGKSFRVLKNNIHLAPNSPLIPAGDALIRLVSAFHLLKTTNDRRFAFSTTFSANEETKAKIHDAFLKFLREIEPMVQQASSEEAYQMNFDLFPWRF